MVLIEEASQAMIETAEMFEEADGQTAVVEPVGTVRDTQLIETITALHVEAAAMAEMVI